MYRLRIVGACVAALVCTSIGVALHAAQSNIQEERIQRPVAGAGAGAAGVTTLVQGQVAAGGRIPVLIELEQEPGAITFAGVLERAGARTPQAVATAASAAQAQIARVEGEQQTVAAALASPAIGADEMFRVRRVMNGIAATVNGDSLAAIRRIPGVKAVHVLELEYPTNSTSVPFLGTPAVWGNTLGLGLPVTGAGIRVGVIDTGVDYQHATFGGTGVLADYQANDRTAAPDAYFPSSKVVGGWDFVGDAYNGGGAVAPDADPMDCNGHGTHVAGTAAGYGVTAAGATFAGPFDTSVPFSSLRIGPGTAPQASIYALRIFGCTGGTNVTVQAIDWAMDPNDDNDLSDRLDVINMSLGSNFGTLASATAQAADNAAAAGVIVVTSAGNSGDTYFIGGSPGAASRVISTAASIDSGPPGSSLHVNAPGGIAGDYLVGRGTFGPAPPPNGVTGDVVLGLDPADGAGPLTTDACSPLTNAGAIAGNVALVDRGTCGFAVKVENAQNAGAIAVIVANSNAGVFGDMGGTSAVVVIPSVMVTFADGNAFKTAIPGLNVTFFSDADTLASFSSRGPRGGGGSRTTLKPDIAAPGYQIVSAQTGVTCTAGACQTPNGSGFLPNSPALTLNGTSMAAPHVAGVMALLRQLHPTWTVEELKALVMNSALHDVTTFAQGDTRYGPGRIGAGRVDAALAAQAPVVAFNADESGQVSLSFDGDVQGSITRVKRLHLVNHGATAQTYDLAIDTLVDAPGVSFSLPGGSSVTLAAGQSIELTVQMTADASQMKHTRDASVTATQTPPATPASVSSLGPLPRHWLTEEAGYLVLSQGGTPRLRVPVYTAPAAHAAMEMASDTITTGGAGTGSTTIPLSGTGLCTGTLAGSSCSTSDSEDVASLVTPLELQIASPADPVFAPALADIRHVGVGYEPGTDRLLFGVSTYGAWKTPNDVSFNIYVDCGVYTSGANFAADTCNGVPDGIWDLILFNTNPGSLSALFGTTAQPQDSFITAVFVRTRNSVVFGPPNYVNSVSSAVADTRAFDNDVMLLPVDRTRLKVSAATGTFQYFVYTCPGSSPLCQALNGFHYDETPGATQWNYLAPGLSFGGESLEHDQPGAAIPVSWNTASLAANGSLGALLLHYHNAPGQRAEVAFLDTAPSTDLGVTMTASTTTPAQGDNVTLTLTVTNHGGQPASAIQVYADLPASLPFVSSTGDGAYDDSLGLWTLAGPIAPGASAARQITVTATTTEPISARATIGTPIDGNVANNQAVLGLSSPPQSDVQITAMASGPVLAGTSATVTVTLTNAGQDPAYGIVVSHTIIAGMGAIVSGTPTAGSFIPATGDWHIASLGTGGVATLTLSTLAQAGPTLTVQAQAGAAVSDPNLANNTSPASLAVIARETTTSTQVTPATVAVGEASTIQITVTDTEAAGAKSAPAGIVSVSTPVAGAVFSPANCALVLVTPEQSSCSVTLTPATSGPHAIAVTYAGLGVHAPSADADALNVDRLTTTTTASNATVVGSDAAQTIALTAAVTSSRTVNEGSVTFTVTTEGGATIGTPGVAAVATNGTATLDWELPAGTPAQTLHIAAAYGGSAVFATSSDVTKTLTIVPPTLTYMLGEGATGEFFDTQILLANPHQQDLPVTMRFLKGDGTTIEQARTLAPMSRTTIEVDTIPGLESTEVSTLILSTSGLPLVVERTMSWDATGYGSHTEKAVPGPMIDWYFAEGSQGWFSTYLLLGNSQSTPNVAHVTYFREGAVPIQRDFPMAPTSRLTVDAGQDPELVNQSFGMRVSFDQPGVAERAMYFGTNPLWTGGHGAAGVTALSTSWYLAEGATGSYFATYLLVANPGTTPANLTITYLRDTGAPVTQLYTLPGGQRLTQNIALADPALAATAVGVHVASDAPVVVERAQYWPQPNWIETHASAGVTESGTRWGLAEGRVGGERDYQTYVLLANPGTEAATVNVTFLRTTGAPVLKTFNVAAGSRFNIAVSGVGSHVPELANEAFGALIESTQPVVVERSLYGTVGGITWATGTNATGTRLP